MSTKSMTLYMVVPCYNEEEVLEETTKQLNVIFDGMKEAGKITEKSRILYVNDGSRDQTWNLISKLHKENFWVSGLNLSRNRGHQNAVLAGLMYAKDHCDAAISWMQIFRMMYMLLNRWWICIYRARMWYTASAAAARKIHFSRSLQQKDFTRS